MTYYLVSGLDASNARWIEEPIGAHLCAPADFLKAGQHQISVRISGKQHSVLIGEKDRIVVLRDLFLQQAPYWTRNPRSKDFAARIRRLHTLDVSGAPGIFAGVQSDSHAVCLAPASSEMVAEFPSLVNDEGAIGVVYDRAADSLESHFQILGRDIQSRTSAVWAKSLANSSVAIWPPAPSPDWRIYVAKGTGTKQSYGRWVLVDERAALPTDWWTSRMTSMCRSSRCCRALSAACPAPPRRSGPRAGILILSPFEEQ